MGTMISAAKKLYWSLRAPGYSRLALERLARYKLPPQAREALVAKYDTELGRLFFEHRGRIVHKWLHYLAIYERYFAPFRGRPVKFLEIGVSDGGSLELWREYFGVQATIFGVDIDPGCTARVTAPNQVRIGSQADAAFLEGVASEMGTLDVVLDDGSHIGRHQRASFDALFPLLSDNGLYVIEDLHTSYWHGFHEGGYRRRGTAIEYVKGMIDDMHAWYHERAPKTPAKSDVGAIHVYDGIVVIEKAHRQEPAHIRIA